MGSLSISIKGDKEREGWEGESGIGWMDGGKGGETARRWSEMRGCGDGGRRGKRRTVSWN